MKYDFDTVIDRHNTGSVKWDVKDGELPMWVADMDFQAAPEIREAIQKRMDNGVYGYSVIPDEWRRAYVHWWKTRHNYEINPSSLLFATGVVPIIASTVRELTAPDENVLIQPPVYNAFYNVLNDNRRRIIESPLVYENGEYRMDLSDLEKKLSDPKTTLMILCNPQNPSGNIWDRDTLEKIGQLCAKHNVTVLSDEIHCDITDPGTSYIPFASVSQTCSDICVTTIAPTKAFNIAGIQSSAAMVPNRSLRDKIRHALNTDLVSEPNAFSVVATVAAFEKCAPWLDELRSYLYENKKALTKYINENIPQIHVVPSKATYLVWLDCSKLTSDSVSFASEIRRKTGLFLSNGTQYGESGRQFLRFNLACPRSVLMDGLDRLRRAVN